MKGIPKVTKQFNGVTSPNHLGWLSPTIPKNSQRACPNAQVDSPVKSVFPVYQRSNDQTNEASVLPDRFGATSPMPKIHGLSGNLKAHGDGVDSPMKIRRFRVNLPQPFREPLGTDQSVRWSAVRHRQGRGSRSSQVSAVSSPDDGASLQKLRGLALFAC